MMFGARREVEVIESDSKKRGCPGPFILLTAFKPMERELSGAETIGRSAGFDESDERRSAARVSGSLNHGE